MDIHLIAPYLLISDQLPRVHDPRRIEPAFNPAQRRHPRPFCGLHMSDAVLGGDRAAGRDDRVVKEARDTGRGLGIPASRIDARRRADVEMYVAAAQYPNPLTWQPGKCASHAAAADSIQPGIASTGTEMSCCTAGPSARSALDNESGRHQKLSACASIAAIVASPIWPSASAAPNSVSMSGAGLPCSSPAVASISRDTRRNRQAATGRTDASRPR